MGEGRRLFAGHVAFPVDGAPPLVHSPSVPTHSADLDTRIATLTAFRSLAHLKAHVNATGWTPSFRYSHRDGVALANDLAANAGILCRLYN